jgi:hypothetical protein
VLAQETVALGLERGSDPVGRRPLGVRASRAVGQPREQLLAVREERARGVRPRLERLAIRRRRRGRPGLDLFEQRGRDGSNMS